ncbi:AbrB/MazE/SpoVT family DNA-binding domain-containing protein [Candidatus Woesearchaeota archaeon]|nr:AbrB/MazE/SpoVT family DNA-binding domain-containing protein [Candidatus Woesearchaeota archaeon]
MIETIRVSSRGQMVIPEAFRKVFHIKEGTKLILLKEDNKIILEKEEDFMQTIKRGNKEKFGWLSLAEVSMKKIWENKKDEEVWKKYL